MKDWNLMLKHHQQILRYLHLRLLDSKEVNHSEKETQHNWINLTDLDPGKQYRVAVVASNPVGGSSRSDPKEFILGKSDGLSYLGLLHLFI